MTSTSSPDTGGHDRRPPPDPSGARSVDTAPELPPDEEVAQRPTNKTADSSGPHNTGPNQQEQPARRLALVTTPSDAQGGASDDSLGGGGRSPRDGTHSIGSAGTSKDGASELCYGSSPRSGQHGNGGYINADSGGRNVEPETASHPSPDTS
ncbi:hypothetical protein PR001_g12852 [Phytophthora rubi]|uniref:Uncharacterized protein n=1 Tax=Phytophthora rubi TaxID=129364 RepID=A0A6A3M5Z2_9STRA|nr:hypothetical protein PR001_g12852 [Phytophthora rubi]